MLNKFVPGKNLQVSLTCRESNENQLDKLSMEFPHPRFNEICRHEIFQIFGRFQIFFYFKLWFQKLFDFIRKLQKTVLDRKCRGFQTFYGLFQIFFMKSSVSCLNMILILTGPNRMCRRHFQFWVFSKYPNEALIFHVICHGKTFHINVKPCYRGKWRKNQNLSSAPVQIASNWHLYQYTGFTIAWEVLEN